jgi:hypothetical protein
MGSLSMSICPAKGQHAWAGAAVRDKLKMSACRQRGGACGEVQKSTAPKFHVFLPKRSVCTFAHSAF